MKTRILLFTLIFINTLFLNRCTKPLDPFPDCNLSGTVTEFGSMLEISPESEALFIMYIDVDADPHNNNHVHYFTGTFKGNELHYSYDISDVEPGDYYVYFMLDLGGGFFNAGYYGAEPMPWDAPASPNVHLKCRTVLDWQIIKSKEIKDLPTVLE